MKINTEWNSGKFSLTHEAEVSEVQLPVLAAFGLRYLVQRNREHDKILGAFTTDKTLAKNPKGDGPWRRKDWTRSGVEFTEALAAKLTESYGAVTLSEDEDGEAERLVVATLVGKYDGGKQAEPKYAREKKKFAEKESSADGLEAWLKSFCGYAGPTHGEDGEYAEAALAAAKGAIDRFLANI